MALVVLQRSVTVSSFGALGANELSVHRKWLVRILARENRFVVEGVFQPCFWRGGLTAHCPDAARKTGDGGCGATCQKPVGDRAENA